MSIHENNFYSNTLEQNVTTRVILPEPMQDGKVLPDFSTGNNRIPTVWLLHGLGGDSSDWIRKSNIEEMANKGHFAVVMPQTERGFYTNMISGPKYWDYITDELPKRMRFMFPLSESPKENIVMGISMGGYGALRWGLTYPERFAGIVALSPAVDLIQVAEQSPVMMPDFDLAFDRKNIAGTPVDIDFLLNKLDMKKTPLRILMGGGTKDFLLPMDIKYSKKFTEKIGSNYTWKIGEGTHDWPLWNSLLPDSTDWITTLIQNH